VKVRVDMSLCEDHGQCAIAAPDVFRMNDESKLEYVENPSDDLRAEVEEAADVCPVQAIFIEA
jgi:ferredoxin